MRPDKSVAVPNIIERAPVRQNEKGAVNEGICTGHRRSRRQERRVSPGALHGKALPARLNAVKAQGRDRAEVHKLDQFFRVEEGTGEAVLDGVRTAIQAGWAV